MWVLLIALAASATAYAGGNEDPNVYTTLIDDFKDGFTNYFSAGPYVGDNGVAKKVRNGLCVTSPGKNPRTGEPAYTLSPPFNDPNVPGDIDHVKFLVFANHTSSGGFPGWDTKPGYTLTCEAKAGGRSFGTQFQPFGKKQNPNDPNLAFFGGVNGDFEKFMIFDFALTNDAIYALYERLPFGRTKEHNYASFTHLVPIAKRKPNQMHRLAVSYDRSAKTVKYLVDGKVKFTVDKLGYLLENKEYLRIDRGGVEEDAGDLNQLVCGFGTFSLMDGYNSKMGKSLVRLVPTDGYYRNPMNPDEPLDFVDNGATAQNTNFGQGAELTVSSVTVSSTRSKR